MEKYNWNGRGKQTKLVMIKSKWKPDTIFIRVQGKNYLMYKIFTLYAESSTMKFVNKHLDVVFIEFLLYLLIFLPPLS